MYRRTVFLSLVISLTLLGCRREPVLQDEVPPATNTNTHTVAEALAPEAPAYNPEAPVAIVNENILTAGRLEEEVDIRLKNAMTAYTLTPGQQTAFETQNRAAARTNVVRQFVIKALLMDEAARQNVEVTEEDRAEVMARLEKVCAAQHRTVEEYFKTSAMGEARMRQEFEDSLRINKLVKLQVADIAEATQEEILKFRANADRVRNERRAKLEGLRRQLLDGASFAEVAKEHSEDVESAAKGGDIGVFRRGQVAPEFEEAAFSQKIGEIGPVVRTKFGLHIIKVNARTPAEKNEEGEVIQPETCSAQHILLRLAPPMTGDHVKALIKRQRTDEAAQAYVRALMKNARVGLGMKNIQF